MAAAVAPWEKPRMPCTGAWAARASSRVRREAPQPLYRTALEGLAWSDPSWFPAGSSSQSNLCTGVSVGG
ncbi:hypothetical protein F751_4774 [Auxenochlorella protothecoides]|uniref:Uncharacterized protein n=1 Tax=Auxenochlorella protothecoides TaxID=3075 RepID=A0A087SKM7_AUXPR|nr:hypothetical protein F751_4774 [Auxenochlorella protothecoides]KFM26281.1 hypothetical protein F751_4774 [Auxenochlorella protothecoides]